MPELLLELFSEEIPARMQDRAADDLARLMSQSLGDAGLTFTRAETHAGPRRVTLVIEGLPAKSADVREEKKGPRVGAPEKAMEGFLRSAGLASLDACEKRSDGKGEFYVAIVERPGRATPEIVAAAVPDIVRKFPWPKSMRWGAGRMRWVRPLHSILCLFDGKSVEFEVDGIKSGGSTEGHRFLNRKPLSPKSFADYAKGLEKLNVIVSHEARAARILEQAKAIAAKEKLALVEDMALLEENAGLAEWPTALAGGFDKAFLDVPAEILMTSMKAHQKCFSLKEPKSGKLANRFILVSNLQAQDGGKAIITGNERVIRARLSDARFFWQNDRSRRLDDLLPKLDQITFHEKLGTQGQRVERIAKLARELAPLVKADAAMAERAARLCKADLVSETVGEFPELQGIIGRYIALEQGEPAEVAEAIAAHYKPQGPADAVPVHPVSIAVALADKLDMLAGFWTIGEKPTGSKDPYALRRAALGIIRIVLENKLRLPLMTLFETAIGNVIQVIANAELARKLTQSGDFVHAVGHLTIEWCGRPVSPKSLELLDFFGDRLKVYLRDTGARHDLIDAVFSLPGQDDLLMIVRRVEALGRFLASDDGANLLTGIRRAQNILRIEEKKDGRDYGGHPDAKLIKEPAEKGLVQAIKPVVKDAQKALKNEDFEGAMTAFAKLRAPVDAFFDKVTVNTDDRALRENRLKLLSQIRDTTRDIADFSKIEG